MRKLTLDKWSDYPLRFQLNIRIFFLLNSRFFHPKPLFILSLWFFAIASIFSLKLLKIFVPLALVYFYQKMSIKRSLKNFRIKRIVPEVSKEEKTEDFKYQIDNPNPFHYFNFSVFEKNETSSDQRILNSFTPILNPHQSIRLHHLVKMNNGMGFKKVGPLMAVFTDSLGINRVTYLDDYEKQTKIYPTVYPTREVNLRPDNTSMTFGNFDSHQLGNNVNFYSTREYVQGDNTNHINWKLSLKSSSIIVNQFESNVNAKFYTVLIDDERIHYGEGKFSSLEYCKDLMLSLLYSQVKSNNEMGLYSSQKFIKAQSGQSHLNAIEIFISTLGTAKLEETRTYSRKHVQKKKIQEYFKKLCFFVPEESNLFIFGGFIPGAILETYINELTLIAPRYQKIHLILTYGLGHLKQHLSKEEESWVNKMDIDSRKMSHEIYVTCKKNNITLSLVDMNSKFKYSHLIKEGFQRAKL